MEIFWAWQFVVTRRREMEIQQGLRKFWLAESVLSRPHHWRMRSRRMVYLYALRSGGLAAGWGSARCNEPLQSHDFLGMEHIWQRWFWTYPRLCLPWRNTDFVCCPYQCLSATGWKALFSAGWCTRSWTVGRRLSEPDATNNIELWQRKGHLFPGSPLSGRG